MALTAVVWDGAAGQYVLKTFRRDDPACAPFLVHLGRAFIVEATLQAGVNKRMRCQSYVNIPASEMFAAAGSGGRDLRQLPAEKRTRRGHLVPLHRQALAEGLDADPALPVRRPRGQRPVQLPFSDNIPRRCPTCWRRSTPATRNSPRCSASCSTTW